jgi:transcriptional regulator with XRE-family HTH domain
MTTNPDPIDVEIGCRIRSRRLALGRNQSDLARALGVSFQQVQKYENGANRVSGSMMHRTARYLGCEVGELFPPLSAKEAASDPATVLGATRNGHELARLYVAMTDTCRASILDVARAIAGATAIRAAASDVFEEAA